MTAPFSVLIMVESDVDETEMREWLLFLFCCLVLQYCDIECFYLLFMDGSGIFDADKRR